MNVRETDGFPFILSRKVYHADEVVFYHRW